MDRTPRTDIVSVGDARLRTAIWGSDVPSIVMLHDGLGSISQWRDVPSAVHERTGATVAAYERAGHGASTPVPTGPWPADWLHREAVVLGEFLDVLGIDDPVIIGHSDGGSISLIHAATGGRCRAVAAIAAHSWVEPICASSIREMRADTDRFVNGLERYHDAPAAIFEAWSGVWVSKEFATWDIRPLIGAIDCPALIAQGSADEYASDAQLTDTAAAIGANASFQRVDGGRHILHHQQPEAVVDLVATFHREHATSGSSDQAGA